MSGKMLTTYKLGTHTLGVCFWLALLVGASALWSDRTEPVRAADPPSLTETKPELRPVSDPLDLNALVTNTTSGAAILASAISQTGLTIPSLWWVKDQYAAQEQFAGKLVENWIAYPEQTQQPGRVDFVVNRQLWSLLDYLDRYSFIHEFGTAASSYRYNIRVFDNQATLLAAYTCDFRSIDDPAIQRPASAEPDCSILLDSSGKSGLRGRSNPFDAGASKGLGTVQP